MTAAAQVDAAELERALRARTTRAALWLEALRLRGAHGAHGAQYLGFLVALRPWVLV